MRISIIIGLILLLSTVLLVGCQSKIKEKNQAADPSTLASCLTQKGWIVYGREFSEETQEQKQLFGKYFDKINFVDCDLELETCFNTEYIKKYPTWIGPDGKRVEGVISLEKLEEESLC